MASTVKRWHWENAAPSILPPLGSWDLVHGLSRVRTGEGESAGLVVGETTLFNPVSVLGYQVVSEHLPEGLLSGTFRSVLLVANPQNTPAQIRILVRLVSNSGGIIRGTLVDVTQETKIPGSGGTKTYAISSPITPVMAETDDHLVVEIGVVMTNKSPYSRAVVFGSWSDEAPDAEFATGLSGASSKGWFEIESPSVIPSSRLVWSSAKAPYETGLDRGVLYPTEGPGVAWGGLVSVEDSHVGGEIEPLYLDGVLFHNLPSNTNYQASLTAFSAPDEFAPSNGEISVGEGLILTRQPRQRFGLSYRTLIGDELGYQIHLVYNALATPTGRGFQTLTNSPSPNNPTWTIDAVPVDSYAPRPTSHYILDSTKIGRDPMEAIEGLLYGTVTNQPYLPSIRQIVAIATQWDPQTIMPNYLFGVSELIDGMGDVQEVDVDGIYIPLPNGRLTEIDIPGIYLLTE